MKICPKCQKTYADETLNFCLNDGAVLTQVSEPAKTEESLPETVMMDLPRPTDPNQSYGAESQSGFGNQSPSTPFGASSQPNWGNQPVSQITQPKPKSKAWLWVLGILAGVVFLCGGGLALIVAFSNFDDPIVANEKDGKTPKIKFEDPTPKTTSNDKADFRTINISNCGDYQSSSADAEYKNDECILKTKKPGYYYVIVTSSAYQTDDGRTRVTVRNTDEKNTRLGFGLVFHSKPTPLQLGYAFLIDSEKQKYRVVKHKDQKETVIVNWKTSKVIKTGTQKNVLEVRADEGKIDLYINDQYIETLKNTDGYEGGVPGIYTGDGIPVAFSNLQTTN
jgi:hypothetical protein